MNRLHSDRPSTQLFPHRHWIQFQWSHWSQGTQNLQIVNFTVQCQLRYTLYNVWPTSSDYFTANKYKKYFRMSKHHFCFHTWPSSEREITLYIVVVSDWYREVKCGYMIFALKQCFFINILNKYPDITVNYLEISGTYLKAVFFKNPLFFSLCTSGLGEARMEASFIPQQQQESLFLWFSERERLANWYYFQPVILSHFFDSNQSKCLKVNTWPHGGLKSMMAKQYQLKAKRYLSLEITW